MSPIALGLDILLVALLLAALVVGVRLNRRLTALRQDHQGFAKAVAELDAAAARAEKGLAHLRAAADETHDQLLNRIETARGLIGRLEAASTAAERAAEKAAAIPAAPAPRASRPLRFAEPPVAPAPERSAAASPFTAPPTPAASRIREAFASRRAATDDDLFDDKPRRSGGR